MTTYSAELREELDRVRVERDRLRGWLADVLEECDRVNLERVNGTGGSDNECCRMWADVQAQRIRAAATGKSDV